MKTFQSVIVDDEQPAHEVIQEYVDEVEWISIIGTFRNPQKALNFINSHNPDVLFLDIQMPRMSGFELVDQLDELPHIIFSTAYDEYAIRAFDINAVDYLLKPYTKERFFEALNRLKKMSGEPDNQNKRIRSLLKQIKSKEKYPPQLFIRSGNKIAPVQTGDILWIEANGDYTRIHLKGKELFCSTGLGKLMDRLDPDKFVRIHRSHAVAIAALKKLDPNGYGGFTATLTDNTKIKVSRNYTDRLSNIII